MRRAMEVLQPGLKQAPDDGALMTLAGEISLQSGEFAKAAEYFDKATKNDPKNAVARTKLGLSRMATGDTDRAFADLESAVELDTTKYQTDMVLVVSYLRRGSYDQALKAMESLEKKQPNNPITFNLKAVIFLGKKDIPNARKHFERALEFDQSTLFKKIYEEEYGTFGGAPYGALIGDFEFGNHPQDMALLEKISEVAAAAHAPESIPLQEFHGTQSSGDR